MTPIPIRAAAVFLSLAVPLSSALHAQDAGDVATMLYDPVFATADADGNGRLVQREINAFGQSVFAAMDTDRSGTVSRSEFIAVDFGESYQAMMTGRLDEVTAVLNGYFERADTDGDGTLTMDEHRAVFFADWRTADIDGDGDNMLDRQEFMYGMPVIRALAEIIDGG